MLPLLSLHAWKGGVGANERTKMVDVLSRYWWAFVVRGFFAILFGILAYTWPGITLAVLLIFFGAYVLIDGILLVIKTIAHWSGKEERWLLLLEGLLGIGIGIITFIVPGVTAIGLVLYIAVWSLATGVLEIAAAVRLRKEIKGEAWMIVSGIVSILFAVLLMIFPGVEALGLLWLIAVYAIIFGVVLVILGFKLRRHRSQQHVGT
ncbi:MAG TPA: HdeD family acid-resistance protein [Syntrophorhabdaceae bacterium]|nr:HdeD family acid-resistance protein [Syntrophorhabdaceae bacterium]